MLPHSPLTPYILSLCRAANFRAVGARTAGVDRLHLILIRGVGAQTGGAVTRRARGVVHPTIGVLGDPVARRSCGGVPGQVDLTAGLWRDCQASRDRRDCYSGGLRGVDTRTAGIDRLHHVVVCGAGCKTGVVGAGAARCGDLRVRTAASRRTQHVIAGRASAASPGEVDLRTGCSSSSKVCGRRRIRYSVDRRGVGARTTGVERLYLVRVCLVAG